MPSEVAPSPAAPESRNHPRAQRSGGRIRGQIWKRTHPLLSGWFGASLVLACSSSAPGGPIESSPPLEEPGESAQAADAGRAGADAARSSSAKPGNDAQAPSTRPDVSPGGRVDPPGAGGGQACGGASYHAEGKELEIFVLFDNSFSMLLPAISWDCLNGVSDACVQTETGFAPALWEVAVAELKTFVNDPASGGISLAMKYFGTDCDPAAYAVPDVPVGTLPERAAAITESLDNTLPLEETATRPALEGALAFLRKRAEEPGYNARQVVLLLTDGMPDEFDCEDNTTQSVSRIAAQGLAADPSIATYVFVTAPDLPLDEIAIAGGTEKTVPADLSQPGALATALNAVRTQEIAALPCEYEMPAEYYMTVRDPSLVNLTHNGEPVGMVPTASACADAAGGWYYDEPSEPSRLLACPATCENLKSGGSVEILLECPTITLL